MWMLDLGDRRIEWDEGVRVFGSNKPVQQLSAIRLWARGLE